MENRETIPCVSIPEPLFTGDPPACTRTWEADVDPKLNHGQVVDRHADLAAWARLSDIPKATYLGHTEDGEQIPIIAP